MVEKLPFRPLFARVLLERAKVEKFGSIILPESAQARYVPTKGVVLDCGETCHNSVTELIGKQVFFAKYAGDWLKVGDREFFLCQDEDILGEVYE